MSSSPAALAAPREQVPSPPIAEPRPSVIEVHGTRLSDDYGWLKAPNWKDVLREPSCLPADIARHLEQENAYTEQALADLEPLRRVLVGEMRARIKEDEASVPTPDGPWEYLTRHRENGQHEIVCRMARGGGTEEILLDGDLEARNFSYFELSGIAHSPDHTLLAWSADRSGAELYTVRLRDLGTGRDLEDEVRATSGDIVWSADSRSFYYVEVDENHRPVRVRRHRIGEPAETDAVIYEEPETGWFVTIDQTSSHRFLVVGVSDHETSESWLLDLEDPSAELRLVAPRAPLVLYAVEHHGCDLMIRTNDGGAEDFKLVTAPVDAPGREHWRDLVPHRPGIMVLYHAVLARHLIRVEREDANPRIVVREIWTGAEHAISFPQEAYALSFETGYEFDTDTIRFVYSSLTTPNETWDYDLTTRERVLRHRQEVPSGFDGSRYRTSRVTATAPDGKTVPISLVHRADLVQDGTAPCLLYGYGSYGSSIPASFRTNLLSLVDRGFVYAIAHVRGGTEKGWGWYLDGKRNQKPNTFTDFVACADALIGTGYTARGRIVAYGGSAGGMLMGAVANIGGDRFAGIVADVPFVDVLNTMLDGDLPLTPPEWPEWGNPGRDEEAFRTILSYSPYDNVVPQRYPAILALGGLTDPRVTYWEPAKWVAKLRATMLGGGPVFLRINMEAGHGGAAGRFDRLEEIGLIYAFALRSVEGGWPDLAG
ncbi:S9 family peptidase [Enterovirga sp.]|uniref:S9 family peptidase n=1 Tax=Enterovirga sp. TaxID=2026350 RepID=UPI00261C0173|nr:S9 family peptidase [Enterovirga sp.]MDB5590700.1 family peptidase [Enterovirga sp.]